MLRLTLDHNCICAVEDARPESGDIRALKVLHDAGHVRLRFVCVSAFERPRAGDYIPTLAEFHERLRQAGLDGADVVKSIAYYDMGLRYDSGIIYGSDDDFTFEQSLYRTLFPGDGDGTPESYRVTHDLPPDEPLPARYKNRRRDSLTLWGHIHNAGDIFVTTDGNFRKETKLPALIALGAKAIMQPGAALQTVEQQSVDGG